MGISPFCGDVKEWNKLVKRLKEQFGIEKRYPLRAKLEPVLEDYRLESNNFVDARAIESKALLSKLSIRLDTLSGQFRSVIDILKRLGLQEKADISLVSQYLTQRGNIPPLLASDLAHQLYIGERAARKVSRDLWLLPNQHRPVMLFLFNTQSSIQMLPDSLFSNGRIRLRGDGETPVHTAGR